MPFTFTPLEIPDVVMVQPKILGDHRGYFFEVFKDTEFAEAGINKPFVQINQSRSSKGVLRGLHYQTKPAAQAKLVRVLQGSILDVVVDIRVQSPARGKWVSLVLDSETKKMLYVPEGFAHGFLVLSDSAEIEYCCTSVYSPAHERGIVYSDPSIGISWGIANPTISSRDAELPTLENSHPEF